MVPRMSRLYVAVALAALTGCGGKKSEENRELAPVIRAPETGSAQPTPSTPTMSPVAHKGGLDVDGMDRTVTPGDDFFKYANGTWYAKTEIPADRASYGTGAQLVELTNQRVSELVKADGGKVGLYYAAFMDEAAIEKAGLAPLKPVLDRIAALADKAALATELGGMVRADVDGTNATDYETPNILGLWVAQDFREPTKYAPFLLQGGLGMPDRDYYVSQNTRMSEIRTKYVAHLEKLFALAAYPDPAKAAKAVVDLETALAKTHATRLESADLKRGLVAWKRTDFAQKAPGVDWQKLFDAAGLGAVPELVVWHPTAMTGIGAVVNAQSMDAWRAYLTARQLERAAPFLPKAFVDEDFAFHGGVLHGTPALRDRWKRGVDHATDALGEAVGKLYVDKYFPASEKARAEAMVKNVLAAFEKRIDALSWMAPETKTKAKAKLAILKVGVGYPDAWRDYGALEIKAGDALGNFERADKFELARNLAKLGKPVDRGEWVMVPHLVNAVNLPAMNAMNFPAAILQPPYFDPARPEVMDYGAIGAVIGHEISHSFDDQGALFDATGRLANWWTAADLEHFQAAGKMLVEQYNGYKPFPDLAVDGKLTLSENIADVAGLAATYDAYRAAAGNKEAPTVKIGDVELTGDQQFFVSFGQSWRAKYREPALRQRIMTDGHAPGEYRADTVRNLDAWYAAWKIESGKLVLPADRRVRIW